MKTSFAISLIFTAALHAATPDTVEIHAGGTTKTFAVAADEAGHFLRDGSARVEHIASQRDGKGVEKFLRGRARDAATRRSDLVLYETGRPRTEATRRWLTPRVLAWLNADADAQAVATRVGALSVERPAYAKGAAIFTAKDAPGGALALAEALRATPGVASAEPLLARTQRKRFTPNDTYFSYNAGNAAYQWYLRNTGQNAGTVGIDLNVTTVWDSWRGAGMRIGIADDGVQLTHPDLAANIDLVNGYDWNEFDTVPSPARDEAHGTACAGLAAARGNNASGISGAAPEAMIVPLRLLGGPVSDAEEAAAFSWRNDIIQIKSSSWGPLDDGTSLDSPGPLVEAAIEDGVANGRGGLGTIYLWSAGGGGSIDNSNFDGYANNVFAIGVGSVNDQGAATSYSEQGANILISTPSSSTGRQSVVTTDLVGSGGANNGSLPGETASGDFTSTFGGTSASAPLAAGAVALLLQSKPTLGWRDVKEILIRSAAKNSPADAGWANNGAGFHFNHKFGAGLLDTQAAVTLAAGWANLGPMTQVRKSLTGIGAAIPDSPAAGVSRTFTVGAGEDLRVESVALDVGFTHASRGQIEVKLTSPGGMVSQLSTQRTADVFAGLFWKYTSVRHWGESAAGTWTVTVTDKLAGTTGTLNTLILTIYGSNSATTSAPQVNSTLTANTNVGSEFTYQILALNSATSFSATGLPAGLTVNAGTGLISGKAATAGTFNVTIGATNAFGTGTKVLVLTVGASLGVPLGDAVEQPALTWTTEGNAVWVSQTTTTHDGVDAAKSGVISDSGGSTMRVYASGPAALRFWWRVSSELDSDFLTLTDGGATQESISGAVNWTQILYYLTPGLHRIEWTYSKDAASGAGSDAGWVDQVELLGPSQSPPVFTRQPADLSIPANGVAFFNAEAIGAQPITYQWARGGVVIAGATSSSYAISPAFTFNNGSYTCTATNALGSTTSTAALLVVNAAVPALGTAVDNTALIWATATVPPGGGGGGGGGWQPQSTVTHDGVDAARPGAIPGSTATTMMTSVFGPGTLSFWWQVSSEPGADILDFSIDGNSADYITGTVNWVQRTFSIPPGAHTLEWTYSKDDLNNVGSDTGWVDQVVYTQKPYATWAASVFTLTQRVSDTITGYSTDLNGDGVNNLLAYSFGISPTTGAGAPLPVVAFNGTNYTLTYQKNTTATDVTFAVQRSQNLASWTTIATTDAVTGTSGSNQTIRATLPVVAGAPWFYRVQATISP